jgi:hypothetical protein
MKIKALFLSAFGQLPLFRLASLRRARFAARAFRPAFRKPG